MTSKSYPEAVMVKPMVAKDITEMLPAWLSEILKALWEAGGSPSPEKHLRIALDSLRNRDGRATRKLHELFSNDRFYSGEIHAKVILLLSSAEFADRSTSIYKILDYIKFASVEDSYLRNHHAFLLNELQISLTNEIKQAIKENGARW